MTEDRRSPRLNFEMALVVLLILILAWAPFPYGSNRPWAQSVLALLVGALSMLWVGAAVAGGARVTSLTRKLVWPAACFSVALGWALIQALNLSFVDHLFGGTTAFSSLAHPVWSMASQALAGSGASFISVDPARTITAILRSAVGIAAFVVAFELGRNASHARILLRAAVAIGCFYAALGFAELFLGLDAHSWLMADLKPTDVRLSGPFINPNHFATFVGLATLCSLGILLETLRRMVVWDRGRRILARTFLQALSGNAIWLAAVLLLFSTVLLTQSRGGIAAFLVGVVVLVVGLVTHKNAPPSRGALRSMLPIALVFILGIAAWIGAGPILERAQRQGVEDESRAALNLSTLKAIGSAPLLGNGFGAFERYYPLYADGSVVGDVDQAHNDYLETLADLGLPAGLAFLAAPMIMAFFCARGSMTRNRDRLFPAVGAAAAALVGTHAVVDFSLQIPAVAVLFTTLLGLGVSQAWSTRSNDGT